MDHVLRVFHVNWNRLLKQQDKKKQNNKRKSCNFQNVEIETDGRE